MFISVWHNVYFCLAQPVSSAKHTAQNIDSPQFRNGLCVLTLRKEKLHKSNCFQRAKAHSFNHVAVISGALPMSRMAPQ